MMSTAIDACCTCILYAVALSSVVAAVLSGALYVLLEFYGLRIYILYVVFVHNNTVHWTVHVDSVNIYCPPSKSSKNARFCEIRRDMEYNCIHMNGIEHTQYYDQLRRMRCHSVACSVLLAALSSAACSV